MTGFCEHCNEPSALFFIFVCISCIFIFYYLFLLTNASACIKILNYCYYETHLLVSVFLRHI